MLCVALGVFRLGVVNGKGDGDAAFGVVEEGRDSLDTSLGQLHHACVTRQGHGLSPIIFRNRSALQTDTEIHACG